MPTPTRILLTATPRSGNTWLCRMLGGVYRMHWLATHALGEAEWAAMPAEVVCQSHWPRTPGLAARAAAEGFRVLTLARHPLDVLISVLHFARHEPQTRFWLGGAGGDERAIHAARPRDWAFREYATGPRAAALLNVTASWWGRPGVVTVRYEELVRDPRAALRALADSLGEPPRGDLGGVVAANSLAAARAGSANHHFWQGRPGLWRALLTAAEAEEIAAAHAGVFAALGYACDPDPGLDARTADANWNRLAAPRPLNWLRRKPRRAA